MALSKKSHLGRTMAERFAALVGPAEVGGCIPWAGHRNVHGYGSFYAHGRPMGAHRIAVELASGPIPDGMEVDHICHNPPCVNPDHLRVVTGAENKQNRRAANRNSKSRIRGVYSHQGRWRAVVKLGGRNRHIGMFDTPEEAGEAAAEARRKLMPYSDMDKTTC